MNPDEAGLEEETEQQRAGRKEQGAGEAGTVGRRKLPAPADNIVVGAKSDQIKCSQVALFPL